MTIDDIPADRVITMTEETDALFRAARCRPTCHVCKSEINPGDEFQLVSHLGRDEMTCSGNTCGRVGLEAQEVKKQMLIERQTQRQEKNPTSGTANNGTGHFGKGYSRPSGA